ncbi:TPA: Serine/threonine-protein kinase Nek10 [Trebouxia sp. C0006]
MDVLVYNRTKEYLPDVQDQSWSLGKGGCFTTVERYFEKKSKGVFAVKKMPKLYKLEYGDLFQNEARALSHAHIFGVPRVIKYIEGARTTDDICLILELVRGKTLSTHMCSRPAHAQPGWEQQTLGVAVQLLDTLKHLHTKANVCHLDLTITNVMLQDDRSNGWDVLRLIDFGFAQVFNEDMLYIGVRTRDVKPTGATTPYAAPELLRSLQRQWEGAEDNDEFVMINGPAADIWSFAIVCYQMLTGDLPFLPDHQTATSAPAILAEELHPTWEEYESIIECHKVWENACEVAMREGRPVKHPLIDRVRECSSNPDAAADFFRLLFQFKSEKRLLHDAACHSYLSATFDRMKAAPSISMELSSDVVQDDETSGNDDGNGNDAGSSSAEQSTELVRAQQPSQPASAPSLPQTPDHHPMRIPHHPSEHLQSLHTSAETSAQSMAFSVPLPVNNCCQKHNLVESSSCSDNCQQPCSPRVLMPEDPCLLPKPDFIPSQQPTDKDAGAHDPCRGVIGRAYYAAGAVCGVALDFNRRHSVSAMHVQALSQSPQLFWYDVLEDSPPPSEPAAVMLLQIDLESIKYCFFLSSPCDVPVTLPIKPCPVAVEGLCSRPVKPSLSLQCPAQDPFTNTRCRSNLDP